MALFYDTPVKSSSVSITASAAPTRAEDVLDAVKRDLYKKVVLTTPADFIRILDVTLDQRIIKAIKDRFYDSSRGLWKNFPTAPGQESQFYRPFVKLANSINDTVSPQYSSSATQTVSGQWVDIHTATPIANADFVAEIRTDCAFVSNPNVVHAAVEAYESRKCSRPEDSEPEEIDEVRTSYQFNTYTVLTTTN